MGAVGLAVITFVRMDFVRLPTRTPSLLGDGGQGVYAVFEDGSLVHIGSGQESNERNTILVRDEMALRPCFTPVGGIFAGRVPPFGAGTDEASTQARDQSIWSAMPNLSSRTRCNRCQIPACCQSLKRRQQVMPDPHPISLGRYSHWIPVSKTNRMPVRTARLGTGGRPPLGLGVSSGGRIGSITAQS